MQPVFDLKKNHSVKFSPEGNWANDNGRRTLDRRYMPWNRDFPKKKSQRQRAKQKYPQGSSSHHDGQRGSLSSGLHV
jgi:hypothetical protein